jgi:hypothetical protein
MSQLLYHFSFQAAKWNSLVLLALTIIWAGVLACVISSIVSQPFDRKQRAFWIAIVILVPFLGVLSYLPFAFRKEELPHIFLRKRKRPRKKKTHETRAEL